MVAFGWSYHELAVTRSELTDYIRLDQDLHQLAHDMERRLAITQPLRCSGMEEGSSALEGRIQEKRQCSDSDNAERPLKRVRLAQSLGEPDISTMIRLSPTPGELDISAMIPLSPMPGELDISAMMWLSPMPEEQEISTRLQPFGELDISMMQPAQTPGLDISVMPYHQPTTQCPQAYENWGMTCSDEITRE